MNTREKRRAGARAVKIDPDVEQRLAEELRRTGSVPIACRNAGVTPRQLKRALDGDEALRERLEHALLDGHARIEEEIYDRAFGGPATEPILSRGRLAFGWWDAAAGEWINPNRYPGGEEALECAAAEPGATVRNQVITRRARRENRLLLDYARHHLRAWRQPEEAGAGSEILPDLSPAPAKLTADVDDDDEVDAPAIMESVEAWTRKTKIEGEP